MVDRHSGRIPVLLPEHIPTYPPIRIFFLAAVDAAVRIYALRWCLVKSSLFILSIIVVGCPRELYIYECTAMHTILLPHFVVVVAIIRSRDLPRRNSNKQPQPQWTRRILTLPHWLLWKMLAMSIWWTFVAIKSWPQSDWYGFHVSACDGGWCGFGFLPHPIHCSIFRHWLLQSFVSSSNASIGRRILNTPTPVWFYRSPLLLRVTNGLLNLRACFVSILNWKPYAITLYLWPIAGRAHGEHVTNRLHNKCCNNIKCIICIDGGMDSSALHDLSATNIKQQKTMSTECQLWY